MHVARPLALFLLFSISTAALTQPADGMVQRPDVKLYYTSVGQGKSLIILAGGPGKDVRQVQDIVEGLKDMRRCVMVEQRATGRSELAKIDRTTIKLDLYVEDLEALRKSLGLKKLALIGHSWGGMLAMGYAAKYPNNVESMVLVDSGGPTLEFSKVADDNFQLRVKLMGPPTPEQKGTEMESLRLWFYDLDKAQAFANKPMTGWKSSANVSGPLIGNMEDNGYDSRPGLRKLKAPVLLIYGRQDPIDQSTAHEIQSIIKGSKLVFVERAGHFPWVEQPEQFFKAVREFLAKS